MSQQDLILDRSSDIPQAMKVESDVLEPVIVNAKNARFVLPQTGILSRDSVFQFKIKSNGSFLPINAGIFSLISRVDLLIGQQTIQSINSLGLYKAITKSYDTPSYRNNYTRLMNGVNTTMSPVAMNASALVPGTNTQTGLLQPTGVAISNLNPTNVSMAYDMILTNDASTTPTWSVKIGDLFNMLSDGGLELPLFLINSPVSIVFTFNQQPASATDSLSANSIGSLACFNYTGVNTPNAGAGQSAELVLDELLLFADYLYYTDERMFEIEESMNDDKGMSLIYTDLIQVVNAQPSIVNPGAGNLGNANFTFQVPVSNYQVKNMFIAWIPNGNLQTSASDPTSRHPANQAFSNAVFGKYAMMNSVKPYTIQCRVNDELIFPQPLVNDPLKAQESSYVYGSPVNLHTGMYSRNGATLETGVYSQTAPYYPASANGGTNNYNFCGGMNLEVMMTNNMHFLGLNLSTLYGDSNRDAELISQKPIEITGSFPVNDTTNVNYNNYVFVEITKLFSLKSGNVVMRDGVNQLQRQ